MCSTSPRAGSGHRELLERLALAGIECTFFDLSTDVGVPVIGLVQRCRARFPHVVTMAACRATAKRAALRVVEEAATLRAALFAGRRPGDDFGDVFEGGPVAAERFGLLHAEPDALDRFGQRIAAAPLADAPAADRDDRTLVDEVLAELSDQRREVIVVDVTVAEVRALGLAVVRVLVPSLVPLNFAHAIRHLGHPRLRAAIVRNGGTPDPWPIPYA